MEAIESLVAGFATNLAGNPIGTVEGEAGLLKGSLLLSCLVASRMDEGLG
jgi:hypothetical protein